MEAVPLTSGSPHPMWAAAVIVTALGCPSSMSAFPDEYVGVGLELTMRDAIPRVVNVVPEGPADQAGLAAGMEIHAVGGENVRGKTLAEVVALLRGKPGTRVSVDAVQAGKAFSVTLVRRALARTGLDGGGYITGRR